MLGPCSSPTIFPTRCVPPPLFPLVPIGPWILRLHVNTPCWCPRFYPRKCSCPLHPPPPGIGPGGAAHMGHDVYYLLSTGCYKPLLQSNNGGGRFIYPYNSLVRILHLLRNFATFGTVAKLKTFPHIKRYKLTAVQISWKSDKFERRLFSHSKI